MWFMIIPRISIITDMVVDLRCGIIIIIHSLELFTSALADGLSLESE